MTTAERLQQCLGKHISELCPNGYANDADNHCAHFVAHCLEFRFGATCRMMGQPNAPGVNIRVQEIFARCPAVGTWDSRPTTLQECLVFITKASNVNVNTKVMNNVPRKHVGILSGGQIWHYSNSQRKVVKQSAELFARHYPAPDNAMFYGTLLP